MALIHTRDLATLEPKPGWHGRFFRSEAMSFAYYAIDAGASLHEHSHANEEVWNVISGELEITIGGDSFRAAAGAAAIVPRNTAHSVHALERSTVIVVDEGQRGEIGGGERAALSIEFGGADGGSIPFEILNHGRGPGVVREIEIELGYERDLPPPTRTRIPTGELSERTAIPGLSTLRREQVSDGRPVSYVRGAIFYEDASGELHHTTFCRVLDPLRGFVAPPRPGYNYGD